MSDTIINTVTGTITPGQLGPTLMHEHVFIDWPRAQIDIADLGARRDEALSVCIDHIEEIREYGVTSMVEASTDDLGRNVELMAEVATKTGFNIICSTGLYKEDGGSPICRRASELMGAGTDAVAEIFIKELSEGIGDTGIRAGIIKVASGYPEISDYEKMVLRAAAKASVETGAPITTHTDGGILGDEQQRILTASGVPAHRIIIGHSCGSLDFDYHMHICDGGSYLGFDRFGLEGFMPDETRVASILRLLDAGYASQLFVSHDSVWYWAGSPMPNAAAYDASRSPSYFFKYIIPQLKNGGATATQISTMLEENPKRVFGDGSIYSSI